MSILTLLIPVAFCMGAVGLLAFLWSVRDGQYEDLDGAAERVLLDAEDEPLPPARPRAPPATAQPSTAQPSTVRPSTVRPKTERTLP